VGGVPPRVGEQTRECLASFGFGDAEIEALVKNGAVVPLSD
jgi:crotonobetainyl-CoA:carnitine CoA-transferase CaiB-like acyl-CoA transferase